MFLLYYKLLKDELSKFKLTLFYCKFCQTFVIVKFISLKIKLYDNNLIVKNLLPLIKFLSKINKY
jgi:hypothetical protein